MQLPKKIRSIRIVCPKKLGELPDDLYVEYERIYDEVFSGFADIPQHFVFNGEENRGIRFLPLDRRGNIIPENEFSEKEKSQLESFVTRVDQGVFERLEALLEVREGI